MLDHLEMSDLDVSRISLPFYLLLYVHILSTGLVGSHLNGI